MVAAMQGDESQSAFAATSRLREENAELRSQLAAVQKRMNAVEQATGLSPPAPSRPIWLLLAAGAVCAFGGLTAAILFARPARVSTDTVQSAAAAFDRAAAATALSAIDVSSCASEGGPTGTGHMSVTFEPSGVVGLALADQPPFAGTAVGACVASRFRQARIPPFGGAPVKVGKSFVVNPIRNPPLGF
jgi:hypothetical protein